MSEEKAESSSSQETCIYTVETNPSGNGHEIHDIFHVVPPQRKRKIQTKGTRMTRTTQPPPKTGECVKSSYKACLVSAIKKMVLVDKLETEILARHRNFTLKNREQTTAPNDPTNANSGA
ncbi:uncharacterized protein LOC133392073 isoform X2 [Anopheles gambiae]|uniref:uncharacterized protein LOC120950315 isoform X2 n=1 Tax=Anopheles coluzzii TaxID=1518534 RepID=UPI0020FFD8C0|nr:uncharacterized protein LOC120950315 isoform X2 [Anopheles coluzzii]XP_061506119.1 uncharacterized protein LOC133392073 isoform X2 [Anopheles gambiae]